MCRFDEFVHQISIFTDRLKVLGEALQRVTNAVENFRISEERYKERFDLFLLCGRGEEYMKKIVCRSYE